jgi:hypothetical protein
VGPYSEHEGRRAALVGPEAHWLGSGNFAGVTREFKLLLGIEVRGSLVLGEDLLLSHERPDLRSSRDLQAGLQVNVLKSFGPQRGHHRP